MQIRITELPESLTLDDETVFPMVYNNVTQKITFKSLKQVMLYYTNVSYNEVTGEFTFTRSNGSKSILPTNLYKAFKKAEIIDSNIVFTDFSNNTYTIDLFTEEIQEKLDEINKKIETNTTAIEQNATKINTNKLNIQKNANDIKAINDSKGQPNGFAELDSNGQVPSAQLPSYVDDVIEGYLYNGKFYEDSSHTILILGESGKIYVDLVTGKTYRWSGSAYAVISETLALGETSSTAYRGDRGKIAYDHSQTTGNPHNTTKADIGLGNVDNTADANKVVAAAKKTTGTLTIQKNGINVNTFNGSSNITANITVPTKTSEIINDSDFVNSKGTIAVANKIGTATVGGSTTPVYINEGAPTPIGYTISKSVPADAVFTDTTYTNATQSKAGLMSATDKAKLDGVSSDADKVEWQQKVNTGVNIADVSINGTKIPIYAPTSSQYRGDMEKSVYDVDNNGIVDEASKTTGTLTIQKNSVDVGSFNGNADKTVNISVPTKTSQLTNDSNFKTETEITEILKGATVSKANRDSDGNLINATYLKNVYVPGQTITLTKGNNTISSVKGFTVTPNNANTNTWHKLGTFNTKTQGAGGEIWLFGGEGQNNATGQNMWAHLFIKKGYKGATASTTNYVAASYEVFTPPSQASKYKNVKFKVFCTEVGVVDVWVYFPFPYSRAYYYPAGQYDSFTVANTEQTEEPVGGNTYGVEQPCEGGIVATSSNGTSIDEAIINVVRNSHFITYTKGDGTSFSIQESLDNLCRFSNDKLNYEQSFIYKASSNTYLRANFNRFIADFISPSYSKKNETIKSLSVSGRNITYTKGDNTTGTITTQDTTYSNATQSKAGLMSPADKTKLDNISISSMPIGSGCDYYGQTAPEGFLFADGSAISRTEYSELFEIIGTLYGAGDGSTTFNLPNKRKRMSVMLESEDTAFNALGKTGGSVNHILTKAELPDYTLYSQAHTHSRVVTSVSASRANTWDTNKTAASVTSVSSSKGNSASTTITVKSGGSGEAINIMNPYLVCNYIIKVK